MKIMMLKVHFKVIWTHIVALQITLCLVCMIVEFNYIWFDHLIEGLMGFFVHKMLENLFCFSTM